MMQACGLEGLGGRLRSGGGKLFARCASRPDLLSGIRAVTFVCAHAGHSLVKAVIYHGKKYPSIDKGPTVRSRQAN
jgi:hypothetical protein